MPRAQLSKAGNIVAFFRTAPLETAELVLGLCRDEVSGRKSKSADAKARAAKGAETPAGATTAAAAAPAKKAKGAKKKAKSHKKKPTTPAAAGATTETEPALPGLTQPAGEEIPPGEYGGDYAEQP